jgi:hypothetical protein
MSQKGDRVPLPTRRSVQKALNRLCTKGARLYWVREEGKILLNQFECVQRRAAKDFPGDEDGNPKALIEILREEVEAIGLKTQHGVILSVMLDFDDKFPDKAHERQEIAGIEFREGRRQITGGSIRKYHQPKATNALAERLLEREREARLEADPSPG